MTAGKEENRGKVRLIVHACKALGVRSALAHYETRSPKIHSLSCGFAGPLLRLAMHR